MTRSKEGLTPATSNAILLWIAFLLSIAALYFSRDVLIPVALATLLTFLLTPLVQWLQRGSLGRAPAIFIVIVLSLVGIGEVGWVVSNQLIDVINQLPDYRENIARKIETIHGKKGDLITKTARSVDELTKELSAAPSDSATSENSRKSKAITPSTKEPRPVAVEVVAPPATLLQSLRGIFGPAMRPLATVLVVVVLTVFMLMKREDLRNRFIRLVAKRHLNLMTQAMDDAAARLSRYLLMQFLVNGLFGVVIGTILYFLGVPNAALWGVLAGSFRFIPYIGPLIGAALPFILGLAVFDDWTRPLATLGIFFVIELLLANLVEPWLYGAHTGISALAILGATVFWTAIWGPVGLMLAMPLTVCLLVVGRYVPSMEFLYVLLGDEPVLAPEVLFYQRLLAMDQKEARAVCEEFVKNHSLTALYDEVLIPALGMAEQDRHQGYLDTQKEAFITQSVNELIVEMSDPHVDPKEPTDRERCSRVVCLPANDQADEITASMLGQALERLGYPAITLLRNESLIESLETIVGDDECTIVICALPPFALLHARTLAKLLRDHFPGVKMIVGLWNFAEMEAKTQTRIGSIFADRVVTKLSDALDELRALDPLPEAASANPSVKGLHDS